MPHFFRVAVRDLQAPPMLPSVCLVQSDEVAIGEFDVGAFFRVTTGKPSESSRKTRTWTCPSAMLNPFSSEGIPRVTQARILCLPVEHAESTRRSRNLQLLYRGGANSLK